MTKLKNNKHKAECDEDCEYKFSVKLKKVKPFFKKKYPYIKFMAKCPDCYEWDAIVESLSAEEKAYVLDKYPYKSATELVPAVQPPTTLEEALERIGNTKVVTGIDAIDKIVSSSSKIINPMEIWSRNYSK